MICLKINICGISITITFPFAAMITAVLIFDYTQNTGLCILSAFLHELGHISALKFFGAKKINVTLSPLDFKITDLYSTGRTYKQDIIISLCGPAVNLILFALFFCFNRCREFAYANAAIGIFNMLPMQSLDGGRIITAFFMERANPETAERICSLLSILFIIPFAAFGFYLLIKGSGNWSLLIIILYLVSLMIFKKM